MFEKEIKFIIDFTLNRVNKLGSFFPFERLASAEIHPAILLYISSHLDYLIHEDRRKLLQNSSFDYSGTEISRYFNLIAGEIKRSKRLAFEDIKTLVTHAVTFNINYLVRPNWTLSKLIFAENKTRNVNEIKMILNYIYYYDYVKNVFYGYFSKRKILSLSETEFGMILGKIDRQMFSEHTHDLIDNAMVSIGDFFNEGGVNKSRVHTQTVELFLKEKDLMEPLFKLRRAIPAEDKRKYEIEDLRKILYAKEPSKSPPEAKDDDVTNQAAPVPGGGGRIDELTYPEEDTSGIEIREDEFDDSGSSIETIPEDAASNEIVPGETIPAETDDDDIRYPGSSAEDNRRSTDTAAEDMLKESPDDFLARYKSELKSLEDLEAQLDNISPDDDLTFSELDEDDNEPPALEKSEPPVKQPEVTRPEVKQSALPSETQSSETNPSETNPPQTAGEEPVNFDTEPLREATPGVTPDEETLQDELIFEEEELSFDGDDNEGKVSETPSAPVRKSNDILSFLSNKDMEKIVSNVFNEDEEDFVNTMERISESENYEDATEILKAVFSSYKVSPFSRDAVALTNAVSKYFNQD